MNKSIVVPIHLDALFLNSDKLVAEPSADFTNLPFNAAQNDYNYETPYISESFISHPFQNANLLLPKGVHLHWGLPRSLVNGVSNEKAPQIFSPESNDPGQTSDVIFPAVPDRWLIVRRKNDAITAAWLVESNYLHHADNGDNPYKAICYPNNSKNKTAPFRFMGRYYAVNPDGSVSAESIKVPDNAEYLSGLTAIGYGDPTFAAFYPNCHSVFGFHDADMTQELLPATEYSVWGWYSKEMNDPVYLLHSIQKDSGDFSIQKLKDTILDKLSWKSADLDFTCDSMVCLGIVKGENFVKERQVSATPLQISVGNTGTEALSAMLNVKLKGQVDPNNKIKVIEEQLEALQLMSKIAGRDLDIGEKLFQSMHEKGFSPVDSGLIWDMDIVSTKEQDSNDDTSKKTRTNDINFELPEFLANLLNKINDYQQFYDRTADEIVSLKQQLFADWYKYMTASYHGDLIHEDADPDRIGFLIQNDHFELISNKVQQLANTGSELSARKDQIDQLVTAFNSGAESLSNKTLFNTADANSSSHGIFSVSQEPVLNNQNVLSFDGSGSYKANALQNVGIWGVSFYVNISSNAARTGAYFLKIDGFSDSLIGPDDFGGLWTDVYVNGSKLSPFKVHSWDDIPKDAWVHLCLISNMQLENASITLFQSLEGKLASLRVLDQVPDEVGRFKDRNILGLKKLLLKTDRAPRYWLPNDPVVLISGDGIKAGNRNSVPATLNVGCFDFSGILERDKAKKYDLKALPGIDKFTGMTQLPGNVNGDWNPSFLQWEVVAYDNVKYAAPYSNSISPDFITSNYSLETGNYDLSITGSDVSVGTDAKMYSGTTILSPHSKTSLQVAICNYLLTMDEEEFEAKLGIEAQALQNDIYGNVVPVMADLKSKWKNRSDIQDIESFFKSAHTAFYDLINIVTAQGKYTVNVFLSNAVAALRILIDNYFLSQSLGGFNSALLQLHQVMQLPMEDPVGFSENREITKTAAALVGKENKRAPLPLNQFNPIKTGTIKINQLAVIDNFGQILNIPIEDARVIFSRTFNRVGDTGKAFAMPRIVQPARINFRWLSSDNAHDNEVETNSHPATSPVCGWLVPDNLDIGLFVYDSDGNAVGIIQINEQSGGGVTEWLDFPGNDIPVPVDGIVSKHLKDVVKKLLNRSKDDFSAFIELLDNTQQEIDPENFSQHLDLAILMGRPIAVVRASVNLEVKGLPAVNQGWDYFNVDLGRNTRETNGWEKVRFPVLIGEPGILNDGVLGFWDDSREDDAFQSVFTSDINGGWFIAHKKGAHTFSLSISDEAKTFTMLMDPRGEVHATSGILPAKAITIPASQYKPALSRMSMSFFTRPILMPEHAVTISLPEEAGYSWSWLTMKDQKWKEVSTTGMISKSAFMQSITVDSDLVWADLVKSNWVTELGNDKAKINAQNQWQKPTPLLISQLGLIHELFDAGHITPMKSEVDFSKQVVIREGWLKLTVNN